MSQSPAKTAPADTPAMRQYRRFKEQHPECVLFFRMGDFYEMFYEDAKLAHKVLGVTLTQRTEGIPMAGVPYHAVEGYLRRMIQAGYRVAVCEQIEDAAAAKGIVQRDVTRVITPGTLTDDSLLEEGRTNPLAAVMFHDEQASLAWAELSTGAFALGTFATSEIADEIARVGPSELLYVETADGHPPARVKTLAAAARDCPLAARPAWQFRQAEALETLCRQFQVASLAGFGLGEDDPALGAAAAIVQYLLQTQRAAVSGGGPQAVPGASGASGASGGQRIAHLQPPRRFSRGEHLIIDQVSLRSLEVEQTLSGQRDRSLLGVLQDCVTAMGKRALRQWLCYPLAQREPIERRQRVIEALICDQRFLEDLRRVLDGVQDVERMVGRIAVGRALPRDLVALGTSAAQAAKVAELLAERPTVAEYHRQAAEVAAPLGKLAGAIAAACVDGPPPHLREGGLFRDGADARLDEYRGLQRDANTWLAQYQKTLIEQTGIASLKVGFNSVFGYYIELTSTNRDKAPANWSRKQTLKNAERYITSELKEFEGKVLSAEQRAVAREQELFAEYCQTAQAQIPALRTFAALVAELDVLACLARRAVRYRYVKPHLVDEPLLHIVAGRHPVLDELLGDQFVPNDVALGSGVLGLGSGEKTSEPPEAPEAGVASHSLDPRPQTPDPTSQSLALITGPNMAGKSTYIRQAALITLLAHTGSFVPAESATVGLCDRIFTRIGASDELHAGQSTFMVEMTETANICHHATPGSLVILDEIGRGTSTLDGLSLAWAIAEHLALRGCRTLFATHYHELTSLAERFPNVVNLNVTVREWQDQIVFLHRIVPGATDRSYGIHVAKIAGLPPEVVQRANELLSQLEVSHNASETGQRLQKAAKTTPKREAQLSLFTEYVDHPIVDHLRKLDVTRLSPLDAFDLLRKLKQEVDGKK